MSVVPLSELGLCLSVADVQAGCAAAIAAADLPSTAEVQAACEAAIDNRQVALTTWAETGAAAAIAAANLPTDADVQAASAAAIAAAAGAAIPSVVQIQAGLAKTSELQPAADAALTAAIGVAIPTVGQNQSGLATGVKLDAVEASLLTAIGAVDTDTRSLAIGATPLHATVTIAGAPTSGVLIAAPGVGLRNYVTAIMVSVSAQSSFSLSSTGGSTMGTHQIPALSNLTFAPTFQPILTGGINATVVANKTAAVTMTIDVWYYIAA